MSCERKIGPFDCCSVVQGDCLDLMKQLPDGCVDAVITDPPYNVGMDYDSVGDRLSDAEFGNFIGIIVPAILRTAKTVLLTPGVMNLAHYLPLSPKWILAWHKPFGVGHTPVGFSNWEPILFWGKWEQNNYSDYIYCPLRLGDKTLGRHPCPKPVELMRELIRRYSNDESVIFDPFLGSGTTAVAAKKLGRHFLGFEISAEYCRIARDRLARIDAQPRLFAQIPEQQELTI